MSNFRQAAPDPEKADRDGVANYIPSRRQVNLNFSCIDCERTATWEIQIDELKFHACDAHRAEYVLAPRVYRERRL